MRRLSFLIRFILPLFLLIFLNLIYPLRVFAAPTYGWTKTIGGTDSERGQGIAVDSSGNIYTTGYFLGEGVDFDPGMGTDLKDSGIGTAAFITKIDYDGSYGWTKVIEGTENCTCNAGSSIAVDSSGNVYVTGSFTGTDIDFNPGEDIDLRTSGTGGDIFITKINSDGSYGWTKTIGGPDDWRNSVSAYGIAVDSSGNIYTTGSFRGTDIDFDPGEGTDLKTANGSDDIFITKINSDESYGWTKTMGGVDEVYSNIGYGIVTDSSGNVYVTGFFAGTDVDFDSGEGIDLKTSSGSNIFITKINFDGSYGWTKTVGGETGSGYGIAVDSSGNIYTTGGFVGTDVDFDPGEGTDLKTSLGGNGNLFITKINSDGSYGWTKIIGGTTGDYGDITGYSISTDSSKNVYLTGQFVGDNVDFDPGTGTDLKTSNGGDGGANIFITKINSDGSYGWTYTIGGGDPDVDYSYGGCIIIDINNSLYLTGYFTDSIESGTDFDPTTGIDLKYNAASDGSEDIFILKLVGVIDAATPTPSSNSSTLSSAPTCNDFKPLNAPDLFQIDVNATQAKLFYAPVSGNNSNYFITYSEKPNIFQHGTQTGQGVSTGVLSYTINLLKPNTTYYFRVRGQIGCMPGDWSNEMKIKTRNRGLVTKVSYYKSGLTSISGTVKPLVKGTQTTTELIPTPMPTVTPVVQNSKPTETKKRCFLWWCW